MWEQLSPIDRRICELLCEGRTNAEISKIVGLQYRTIKAHFQRIFLRFGIENRYIKRLRLAVLLTYERSPELVPHGMCVPPRSCKPRYLAHAPSGKHAYGRSFAAD